MGELTAWFAKNRAAGITGGLGILLAAAGMVLILRENQSPAVIITEADGPSGGETGTGEELVVDVGGAVRAPGVYRLASGARVAEAIAAAGGFTEEAKADYVDQVLNQADELEDGQKIYIPLTSGENNERETMNNEQKTMNFEGGRVAGAGIINVNTATASELDSLWGIGTVRAQAIIDNRPYASLEELAEKAKLPQDVLEKNEGKLTVY